MLILAKECGTDPFFKKIDWVFARVNKMLFSIQLLIILICLFYGARKGGIALGLLGGIGTVILVFVFHLQPGKPPVDVMLVIIAVVAASATLPNLRRP